MLEGPAWWVQRANMGHHCSLSAVQRKTAFFEQFWWPEFDMFGSMPWCWFPWHKLLPRATPKKCYKVYSLNIICLQSKFDRWVYILVFAEGDFRRFAYRGNFTTVACLCGHQCFSVVAQATQDSPKASPRKTFIEQLKLLLKWMLIERWRAQHAAFNVPTCGKIAVWQLCREKHSFWNSHDGLNFAMVLVPMAQAPPKADARELL